MEKCLGCQFYDRDDVNVQEKGVRWGKCRRTGPIVNPASAKSYMVEGVWPSVRDDDWCGEWVASKRRLDPVAAGAMSSLLMQAGPPPVRPVASATVSLMTPIPPATPTAELPIPPATSRSGSN